MTLPGGACDCCDVCARPLTAPYQVLTDGRRICYRCHETAVYDQAQAQLIYQQVGAILQQTMHLALNIPTAFILVGRDQLADVLQQMGRSAEQVTQTLGVYARHGRKRAIYAQSGLPRLLLLQVMAHEWGHAWQMENAPLLREPLLQEGFAEWIAYQALCALGMETAAARMAARDDVYGRGLRHVLLLQQQVGQDGVLAWCRYTR